MKTKITFKLETDTCVIIMRNGEHIGHMWSESKDGTLPYPHEKESGYCQNSVQLCGFDKLDGPWACGPFAGKRDLVAHFRDDTGEYMVQKAKEYGEYVQKFFKTQAVELKSGAGTFHVARTEPRKELTTLKNFDDWFRTIGI